MVHHQTVVSKRCINAARTQRQQGRRRKQQQQRVAVNSSYIKNSHYGRLVWGKIPGWRTWPGDAIYGSKFASTQQLFVGIPIDRLAIFYSVFMKYNSKAMVVCHKKCGMPPPGSNSAWLFWFADGRVTEVTLHNIFDYRDLPLLPTCNSLFQRAIKDSLMEARHQSGLPQLGSGQLLEWGRAGCPPATAASHPQVWTLSTRMARCLRKVRLAATSPSTPTAFLSYSSSSSDYDSNSETSDADKKRLWKPKAALLKEVRSGLCDIETLCIACDRTQCQVVPHPYFMGGVCENCQEEVKEAALHTDHSDGHSVCCTVCGSPGDIFLCDSPDCNRVYCTGCVELLVNPDAVCYIEDTSPWTCFLCNPFHPDTHGLLTPRFPASHQVSTEKAKKESYVGVCQFPEDEDEDEEWFSNVEMQSVHDDNDEPDPSSITCLNQPLRILSLFDGIGTGLYVLEKLGVAVDMYYATEFDDVAKTIARDKFGSKITYISDLQHLTDAKIAELCPIDLLLGGMPCSDITFFEAKQKRLTYPTAEGNVFALFLRALMEIKLHNKDRHLFWLVQHQMFTDWHPHISNLLQCRPTVVRTHQSSHRQPYALWGNLPGMNKKIPWKFRKEENISHTLDKEFRYPVNDTDAGKLPLQGRETQLTNTWSIPMLLCLLHPIKWYCQPAGTPQTDGDDSITATNQDTKSPLSCKATECHQTINVARPRDQQVPTRITRQREPPVPTRTTRLRGQNTALRTTMTRGQHTATGTTQPRGKQVTRTTKRREQHTTARTRGQHTATRTKGKHSATETTHPMGKRVTRTRGQRTATGTTHPHRKQVTRTTKKRARHTATRKSLVPREQQKTTRTRGHHSDIRITRAMGQHT